MRIIATLFICFCTVVGSCSIANAYTLTFDEFSSGTELSGSFYEEDYGATFDWGFKAVDHTASLWGLPHSGTNVMIWDDLSSPHGQLVFGHFTPSSADPYSVYSVGAYFSTQQGSMVRITAYHFNDIEHTIIPVTSVIIGAADQSWDNQYVVIDSSNGVFDMLEFEGVNSQDDLCGFCADDMTIEPVPEPSSLAALAFGVLPIGVAAIRKKRLLK